MDERKGAKRWEEDMTRIHEEEELHQTNPPEDENRGRNPRKVKKLMKLKCRK